MKQTKLHILLPVASILYLASACGHEEGSSARPEATDLYSRTVSITRGYISKIESASDSATIDSLFSRYRDEIDSINYLYPPETDYHMNEGQNDTISILSGRIVSLHKKKLYRIAHPDTVSVKADSVSQPSLASGGA